MQRSCGRMTFDALQLYGLSKGCFTTTWNYLTTIPHFYRKHKLPSFNGRLYNGML